jgi:hypothetical protein
LSVQVSGGPVRYVPARNDHGCDDDGNTVSTSSGDFHCEIDDNETSDGIIYEQSQESASLNHNMFLLQLQKRQG